jgi:hypothetical protein
MVDNSQLEPPQYDWQTPKPQFDLGRVLSRTFSVIGNNWLGFFLISFLVAGLPMALLTVIPFFMMQLPFVAELSDDAVTFGIIFGAAGGIVFLLGYVFIQAVVVHASFKHLAGQQVSIRESSKLALRYIFPLIGFGIVYAIGVFCGLILVIVPGVILMVGWYLGVPVMLAEKVSLGDVFGRSWELARGYKWWILLTFIIITIIAAVIEGVLAAIALPFSGDLMDVTTYSSSSYYIATGITTAISQTLNILITSSSVAALYYEIRDLKEGIIPETIASVFD